MRQPDILAAVRTLGPCTVTAILASLGAPNTHSTRSSTNHALTRLEDYDLVRRTVPEDRRGGHAEHIWEAVQ